MKRSQLSLFVSAFVILVLILTNPDIDEHRATIKALYLEKAGNEIFEEVKASGEKEMLGASLMDKTISSLIFRDNYVVFSLTKVSLNNYNDVIGLGILGNVFLFKQDNTLKLYNF
ncbi:DUF4359 domain-containing protein [Spirosoma sp. HMF4905]|uniref:DUF4359 domain-containing protein n=1 Tax=Spirosoma arboris TaxID=2682092 RepID=A0A7K1SQK5_9BACT|nr:DUF4359 domain-containing protein [Spirosoma arboris]MVM36094.1 DUF4359 domain-containing protein [Spirosoma arboris]